MAGLMNRIAGLVFVLVLAAGLWGCASGPTQATHPNQKYPLDDVKRRLKDINPGMSKMEVMIFLGSPAQLSRNVWVYQSNRAGILIPAESLHVNFVDGVYVSHQFKTIILGK
jgi:outer membrane protein assembly factor BamE (lipoprotein component of BamABCDE complex)